MAAIVKDLDQSTGLGADETSHWSIVGRMLKLAWQFRGGCVRVLALRFFLQIAMLAALTCIGLGIDVVHHASMAAGAEAGEAAAPPRWPFGIQPPETWSVMQVVLAIAGGVIVFGSIQLVLTYFGNTAMADLVFKKIVVKMRSDVYNKLQRLSFRFFDGNNTGSIINRVTQDVNRVGGFINGVLLLSLTTLLSLVVSLVYMIRIDPMLTLVTLIATTPIMFAISVRFAAQVKPAYRENRKLVDRLILTLSEFLQGIHVVKGFSLQEEEREKFDFRNDDVRDQQGWIFKRLAVFQPTVTMLTQINTMILLGYGGYLYMNGRIELGGGLVVFASLLTHFAGQVSQLANVANAVTLSLTSAQRVFEIIDAPLEITSKPNATRLEKAEGAIRLEGASFGYDPDEPVVQDISFEAKPGSCVALVGATASGKSSIVSLIPRFYDPQQGNVYLDDINVRDLDLDDLRRAIGLVFQESFLFSNSVSANIAFGHPDATQEQIENAAKIAAAHDFILDLPDGYDTIIGENGADLSGGQRQRLAIARAVLLEPAILILDDATAAVDPQTEDEILTAMDNAMKGRTTFVVAHRLSTLRRADLVLVLEKGRIVQAGTHDELMSTRGHYRRAARLQAADPESKRLLGIRSEDPTGQSPARSSA